MISIEVSKLLLTDCRYKYLVPQGLGPGRDFCPCQFIAESVEQQGDGDVETEEVARQEVLSLQSYFSAR